MTLYVISDEEMANALVVLRERHNWLNARIAAKLSVGWDVEWDVRERDALACVLGELAV